MKPNLEQDFSLANKINIKKDKYLNQLIKKAILNIPIDNFEDLKKCREYSK